jgi:hypothetical protein
MMGVHRSTLIRVVRSHQNDGVIRNARGRLTVLNRAKLEKVSCECYAVVAGHYERILRLSEAQRAKNARAAAKHKRKSET